MEEVHHHERRNDFISRHEFNSVHQWVKDIDEKLGINTQQEARMEQRLDELEEDLAEIKKDVKSLLGVWTEAKGAMRVLVWIVGILGSIVTMITWIKEHINV